MSEKTIVLNSDSGIRVGGVTAWTNPTSGTAVGAATVTGRIYDKSKVRALAADTDGDGTDPTLVSVPSAELFVVGEPLELWLDDGTFHETTIDSIDKSTDVITIADAVPAGKIAKEGTLARRKLGPDISMTLYGGTPAASADTWGYRGGIADTHEGLYLGKKVQCEVEIDDGVGRRRFIRFTARVVK